MDSAQTESELAIFTCVLAAALVGTAVGLLGVIWRSFERRFGKPRLEEKRATLEVTRWLILGVVLVGTVPSIVSHWRPEWLGWVYIVCTLLYLGVMAISGVVDRARKRVTVRIESIEPVAYLGAWLLLVIGIFWKCLALLGVIGTALHMKLGPFGPDNYGWGKLFLFIGVGYFATGILLYLIGYIRERAEGIRDVMSSKEGGNREKGEGATSQE